MRRLITILVGTAIALAAGACASGAVPKGDVASSVASELQKKGVTIDSDVTCPTDLGAEVGKSVRCEFTSSGQPVDAVATVTSVQGGQANFDIATEARPVPQALLARNVGEQIGQQTGASIDSSACGGDLPPQVGASMDCTLTGGGETAVFTVTVTAVNGGEISYSIAQQ